MGPWKDLLCVGCGLEKENITNFVTFESYGKMSYYDNLSDIYSSNPFVQSEIAQKSKKRFRDERILDADKAGQDSTTPGFIAPFVC